MFTTQRLARFSLADDRRRHRKGSGVVVGAIVQKRRQSRQTKLIGCWGLPPVLSTHSLCCLGELLLEFVGGGTQIA